jgi:hypothetical protein
MRDFDRQFTKDYFESVHNFDKKKISNHSKNGNKSKGRGGDRTEQKALSAQTLQNFYYSEYQIEFRKCLLYETLPIGDEIRESLGMKPLSLEDGVVIEKKVLV